MGRMKILHVTTHFLPFAGGLEQFVWDLACSQSKHHHVTVLTLAHLSNLPSQEKKNGVHIIRHSSFSVLRDQYRWPFPSFAQAIDRIRPDIVFTHTRFFVTSFLAGKKVLALRKKRFRVRWIHVEHGQNAVLTANEIVRFFALVWDKTIGKWIFRHADRVVAVSKKGQTFIQSISGRKASIISTGTKIPQSFRSIPRIHKVLFFGRMVREKGVLEILIAAEKSQSWHFEMVGTGPLFQSQKLSNLTWTKSISHEQINAKIQSADIVLLPSWSESVSLALLEAAANKRAILATNVGENATIVSPEFLLPRKDGSSIAQKLNTLYQRFDLLQQAGENNFRRMRDQFSREKMIHEYEKILSFPLGT